MVINGQLSLLVVVLVACNKGLARLLVVWPVDIIRDLPRVLVSLLRRVLAETDLDC